MELEKPIDVSCKLSKELYKLNWKIDGFNLIPFMRDHPIFGPSIRLGKNVDSTWQLMMSKQRSEQDKSPSLGFKLVKTEDNTVWDVCRYDVKVYDESGKAHLSVVENALAGGEEDLPYKFLKGVQEDVYTNEDGKQQSDDDSPLKTRKVCTPERISNSSTLQTLFKERVLKVVCDIRYVYMTDNHDEPAQTLEEKLLVLDLKGLLKNHKFSDVILCAGDKELSAHRNLLCCRTLGFDALLKEGQNQVIDIQKLNLDMPASIAELMLLYLYSGYFSMKLDASEYYDLYKASKRFGINHLEELCKNVLNAMTKDEPSCNDCATEEEAFEILMESNKKLFYQIAEKLDKDTADASESVLKVFRSPLKSTKVF